MPSFTSNQPALKDDSIDKPVYKSEDLVSYQCMLIDQQCNRLLSMSDNLKSLIDNLMKK